MLCFVIHRWYRFVYLMYILRDQMVNVHRHHHHHIYLHHHLSGFHKLVWYIFLSFYFISKMEISHLCTIKRLTFLFVKFELFSRLIYVYVWIYSHLQRYNKYKRIKQKFEYSTRRSILGKMFAILKGF